MTTWKFESLLRIIYLHRLHYVRIGQLIWKLTSIMFKHNCTLQKRYQIYCGNLWDILQLYNVSLIRFLPKEIKTYRCCCIKFIMYRQVLFFNVHYAWNHNSVLFSVLRFLYFGNISFVPFIGEIKDLLVREWDASFWHRWSL